MILITGATGNYGTLTIEALLEKGVSPKEIIALARDVTKATTLKEKGVHIREANYDDYQSLLKAFSGVEKLLFVSGNDVENRMSQHENVVKASAEAGVQHILYTSIARKSEEKDTPLAMVAASHFATEELIKKSGVPYSILRNNLYEDVLPGFLGEKVLETGVFFPAGEGKASFALRADMAEATAQLLQTQEPLKQEYFFSNSEAVSFKDIAVILTEVTGKEIAYLNPDVTTYKEVLTTAGVPAIYIDMFSSFAEGIKQGELEASSSDLPELLGRTPVSVATYLQQVYAK